MPQSACLQAPWSLVSQMLPHLQKPCMVSCQEQNPCHNQEVFKLCCSLVSQMLPHLHIVCTVSCQTQPPCHIQQVFMLLGLLSARCCLIYRGHAWSAVRSNLHATISRSSGSLVSGQPDAGPSTRGHVWSAVRSSFHAAISRSSTFVVSD